ASIALGSRARWSTRPREVEGRGRPRRHTGAPPYDFAVEVCGVVILPRLRADARLRGLCWGRWRAERAGGGQRRRDDLPTLQCRAKWGMRGKAWTILIDQDNALVEDMRRAFVRRGLSKTGIEDFTKCQF